MLKRLLSTGLIILVVLGIAPATIFAAETAIVSANKNAVIADPKTAQTLELFGLKHFDKGTIVGVVSVQ